MKILKKSHTPSVKVVISITIGLLLASGGAYAYWRYYNAIKTGQDSQSNDVSSTTKNQSVTTAQDAGVTIKEQALSGDVTDSANSDTQIAITAKSMDNDVLVLRAQITPLLANGTCTLKLTQAGTDAVERTVPVSSMASVSTCNGFNVDVANFTDGVINILLTVSSDSSVRATITDSITK